MPFQSDSLVDWISDTLSQGYTNLQSLVKCLVKFQSDCHLSKLPVYVPFPPVFVTYRRAARLSCT